MVVAMAASPACTVFGGLSDLQGGSPPKSDGGRSKDDAGNPGSNDNDGASPVDASVDRGNGGPTSSPDSILCGAAHCPKGEACCLMTGSASGQLQCSSMTACDAQSGRFLSCTSTSSCPTSAPVCCFSYNSGAQCFAACSPGMFELCDPHDPMPCVAGTACTSNAPGYDSVPACE
jgi:hypothetical protein